MNKTPIEWCTHSLNAIRARDDDGHTGHFCMKVSPGCKHCYASRLQNRFGIHLPDGRSWMELVGKKAAGAMLDGREWREYPV